MGVCSDDLLIFNVLTNYRFAEIYKIANIIKIAN